MTANFFAKKQGYLGARYEDNWRGYKVYKPLIKNGNAKIGYPLRVLEKEDKLRWTTPKESLEYLDYRMEK